MSTKIEYADETLNPFTGCSPCSPGCENCYAARAASGRFLKDKPLYKGLAVNGKWTGEVRTCLDINRPDILEKPLHWKKPRRIFWGDMGDMFHEKVPFDTYWPGKLLTKMFGVMLLSPQHDHLILTKRIKKAANIINDDLKRVISGYLWEKNRYREVPNGLSEFQLERLKEFDGGKLWPIPNLHFGVTICNQAEANEKIPTLLQIPAAHRWISIEPMLGPIDLENVTMALPSGACVRGTVLGSNGRYFTPGGAKGIGLDGVVLGCESGPKRRPCELDWMIDIVRQCKTAGVSVFVKQVNINGRVSHEMSDWPEELRVREG